MLQRHQSSIPRQRQALQRSVRDGGLEHAHLPGRFRWGAKGAPRGGLEGVQRARRLLRLLLYLLPLCAVPCCACRRCQRLGVRTASARRASGAAPPAACPPALPRLQVMASGMTNSTARPNAPCEGYRRWVASCPQLTVWLLPAAKPWCLASCTSSAAEEGVCRACRSEGSRRCVCPCSRGCLPPPCSVQGHDRNADSRRVRLRQGTPSEVWFPCCAR
mgnify:CR=1 FL=1